MLVLLLVLACPVGPVDLAVKAVGREAGAGGGRRGLGAALG